MLPALTPGMTVVDLQVEVLHSFDLSPIFSDKSAQDEAEPTYNTMANIDSTNNLVLTSQNMVDL